MSVNEAKFGQFWPKWPFLNFPQKSKIAIFRLKRDTRLHATKIGNYNAWFSRKLKNLCLWALLAKMASFACFYGKNGKR